MNGARWRGCIFGDTGCAHTIDTTGSLLVMIEVKVMTKLSSGDMSLIITPMGMEISAASLGRLWTLLRPLKCELENTFLPGPPVKEMLFILDLNGTVLERLIKSTEKQAFRQNMLQYLGADGYCGGIITDSMNSNNNNNNHNHYDTSINGNPIIVRPHLNTFLNTLRKYGRVAVWTSMTRKNADAVASNLLSTCGDLAFVWCQEECVTVPGQGKPNASGNYVKPLWRKPLCKVYQAFPNMMYSPMNTIMIDDSREKVDEQDRPNHLHIPEFDIYTKDWREDKVLLRLSSAIEDVFGTCTEGDNQEDIRELVPKLQSCFNE